MLGTLTVKTRWGADGCMHVFITRQVDLNMGHMYTTERVRSDARSTRNPLRHTSENSFPLLHVHICSTQG